MKFIENADVIAENEMKIIDPKLARKYAQVINFLSSDPSMASNPRGGSCPIGSYEYIRKQAITFSKARAPKEPARPKTIPDEMVSLALVSYFNVNPKDVERIKTEHSISMAAENIIGDLLERYLASAMEPEGWIWCSGAIVKAVDFIKPPSLSGGRWTLLQVKNRDNSENSSSSAIRVGTDINKWHRTFSRKAASNWENFPDSTLAGRLSEEGFFEFAERYLKSIRLP